MLQLSHSAYEENYRGEFALLIKIPDFKEILYYIQCNKIIMEKYHEVYYYTKNYKTSFVSGDCLVCSSSLWGLNLDNTTGLPIRYKVSKAATYTKEKVLENKARFIWNDEKDYEIGCSFMGTDSKYSFTNISIDDMNKTYQVVKKPGKPIEF